MKSKKFKTIVSVLLVAVMLATTVVTAFAANNESSEPEEFYYGNSDEVFDVELPVHEDEDGMTILSSYDPRTDKSMTEIEDQDHRLVCWAFTTTSVLSSGVYKKTGLKENYSEESIRFVTSNETANIVGDIPDIGLYKRDASWRGNAYIGANYISHMNCPVSNQFNWISPNFEEDIPFVPKVWENNKWADYSSWPNNIDTSYANAYASEIKFIGINYVKEAILEYGGAYLAFSGNGDNLVYNKGAFYSTTFVNETGHAVEIVGWDDNYSRENFGTAKNNYERPNNDGAWLIKNSWGTGFGEDGYGWISYEDKTFNYDRACFVVSDVCPVSKNEKMLSYDYVPPVNKMSINISETNNYVCMANVYDVSDLANEYGKINKVMFYSGNIGAAYYVYVVPMSENDTTMPTMSELGSYKASGIVDNEGYITAKFKNDYSFSADTDKVAVVIKFIADYNDKQSINLSREGYNSYLYTPTINSGESYYYYNGVWTDLKNVSVTTGNFCIRPTLVKRSSTTQNSKLSRNVARYQGDDLSVSITLNGNQLYSIEKNGNTLLYEDTDFTRSGNTVTFKNSFLSSLSTTNDTDIVFNFTDGNPQTLTIKPRINSLYTSGKCAEGHTLTANLGTTAGTPPANEISYQWQRSSDGTTWSNISGATASTYTLTSDDFMNYIRIRIYASGCTVYYLSGKTATKVVLFGDANLDHEISIKDASLVQLTIAQLSSPFNDEQKLAADVDGDGEVTINDASLIQLYLSQNISDFPVNET